MSKKIISIIALTSLILSTFSGCDAQKANIKSTNTSVTVTPYYSVTNAFADHEETYYYELDIRIPKITYSNEISDSLIDPINDEIYKNITKHVEDAKNDAYNTFEKYLDSAVNNFKKDKEKKIDALKIKYKSVIGSDEVKAIAKVLDQRVEIFDTSTDSEIEAFTDTEGLIIPGLHNKNIIIVETTERDNTIKETSMSINGKPGKREMIAPPESNKIEATIPEVKSTSSDTEFIYGGHDDFDEMPKDLFGYGADDFDEMPKDLFGYGADDFDEMPYNISSPSYTKRFKKYKDKHIASNSDVITDEISLDNFYKELKKIKHIRIPSKRELIRQYNRTSINCTWDVKCLDSEYLSLLIDISESRVSTASRRYYYNIDLKNKRIVKLPDILGEKYKETCVNSINSEIETWDNEKKSTLKSNYNIENFINDDTSFFINNNHTPVVVLDKYMITAGAVGYPEFQIK